MPEEGSGRDGAGPAMTPPTRGRGDEPSPPGAPRTAEAPCRDCGGTGRKDTGPCPTCGGTGRVSQIVGDA
jgi:DnaJ-class molecular chaperone